MLSQLLDTKTKAEIVSVVLGEITGETPRVIPYSDYTLIQWTPEQQKRLVPIIEEQINKKKSPGKIRIDYMGLARPIVIKKALPVAVPVIAGLVAFGYILGSQKKRGKK